MGIAPLNSLKRNNERHWNCYLIAGLQLIRADHEVASPRLALVI